MRDLLILLNLIRLGKAPILVCVFSTLVESSYPQTIHPCHHPNHEHTLDSTLNPYLRTF